MDKGVFELNEKLKFASDVDSKLDSILNRYRSINEQQNERERFIYNSEIEKVKTSYLKLNQSRELGMEIKNLKSAIFDILESNEYSLREFKAISEISMAHQNFVKTKLFVDMLKAPELSFEGKELFECSKEVFALEEFACELKSYASDLSTEESRIVTLKLSEIKKVGLNFTSTVLQLLENYIENADEFKSIEKAVQKEEERDDAIKKVKKGVDSEDPVLNQFYLEYPQYLEFEPKNLKNRIIRVLKSSINRKFEGLKDDKDFLMKLDFIFSDLRILYYKHFDFFDFASFLKEYHSCFKKFIDQKLENVLPEEILGIIEVKGFYYEKIEKDFGLVPESLGEKLIENESVLMKKFSGIACEKLKEWIDNISVIEIEKFLTRDPEIISDEHGKLVSSGFINLLQIIKAQLEPIAYNRKIFIFLTGVIKEKCISFQEKIKLAMQSELKKALHGQGLSGFDDYCIVFGNSGLRLAQYISSLPFFQSDEVRELQSIFLGILQSSHEVLADFIIKTSKPALDHILTPAWAKDNHGKIFAITIEDFLNDYVKAMAEHAFVRFISVLCKKIYLQYLIKLKNDKLVIDKSTSVLIKNDVIALSKLFSKFINETKFKDFLSAILKLCPLLDSSSADLFIVELKSLIILDRTLEKSLVENIVAIKKNMDRDEKETVIAKLPDLFKGQTTKKTTLLQRLLSK